MIISLIVAMSENRVIGCNGRLPWNLPEDLRRFRQLTRGHPVIMGRKTFESIGHPLPGRQNIVLTTQKQFSVEGCFMAHDLAEAFALVHQDEEAFICGGAEVYRAAMPVAQRVYVTLVHAEIGGDILFPELPEDFVEKERREVNDALPCEVILYERPFSLQDRLDAQ